MKVEKIKKITKLNESFDRYDLEVEDNNNFFADNILVHNCRCLSNSVNGVVTMNSRKGKPFPHMDHLREQIKNLVDNVPVYIDGELYSDEMTFQRLVGLVKKQTLSEEDMEDIKKIKYRVYDCILTEFLDCDFDQRFSYMFKLLKSGKAKDIVITETIKVKTEKEIKDLHDKFVIEGFEGAIVRNFKGEYGINKRSKHLQKYKSFDDDEFEIIGFTDGVGKAKGTVIWKCKTKDGNEFSVRPKGTEEQRRSWFNNARKYIGEQLTVRYFGLTDGDKVPRFPVGISIRDYE